MYNKFSKKNINNKYNEINLINGKKSKVIEIIIIQGFYQRKILLIN